MSQSIYQNQFNYLFLKFFLHQCSRIHYVPHPLAKMCKFLAEPTWEHATYSWPWLNTLSGTGGGLLVLEFFLPKYHFWAFIVTMETILRNFSSCFKLGQNLSSCQVSEKSTYWFGRNDGTNIQTDRQILFPPQTYHLA